MSRSKIGKLKRLLTIAEFKERHGDLFATEAALRYHIQQRERNGMTEAGVVISTPLGLRLDETRFADWFLRCAPGRAQSSAAEATAA